MDLVFSAFFAIVSCTWAVLHLCVPVPDLEQKSPKPKLWRSIIDIITLRYVLDWHKLIWLAITFFLPEFVLGKAIAEYASATYWEKRFDEVTRHSHEPEFRDALLGVQTDGWTKTHGFFANMRGLLLRFQVNTVPTKLVPVAPSREDQALGVHILQNNKEQPYVEQDIHRSEEIELQQCIKICGVPCRNVEKSQENPVAPNEHEKQETHEGDDKTTTTANSETTTVLPTKLGPHKTWTGTWALSAAQWFYAYESGIIHQIPQVTREEISDKSKSDLFVKIFAAGQIVWLIIQIIARAVQGLAISLLEITVLAFAADAILIYLFYLSKPQDIQVPMVFDAPYPLTREQIVALASRAPASTIHVHEFWLHGVAIRNSAEGVHPVSPGLALRIPGIMKKPFFINPVLGIGFGGMIFGAVHFSAWNFDFPTQAESIMWRVACVVIIAMPPIGCTTYWLTQRMGRIWKMNDRRLIVFLKPLQYIMVLPYFIARLYLTAESLRQLAYLPVSAYSTVDWSQSLPHLNR